MLRKSSILGATIVALVGLSLSAHAQGLTAPNHGHSVTATQCTAGGGSVANGMCDGGLFNGFKIKVHH